MDTIAPRLLKPEAAADYLGISRAQVFKLLRHGELRSLKIGRSRRVAIEELDAYVSRLAAEQLSA